MLYYKPFVYNLINWGEGGTTTTTQDTHYFQIVQQISIKFSCLSFSLVKLNLVCFFSLLLVACAWYIYIYDMFLVTLIVFSQGISFLEYTGLIVVLWLCYSKSLTVTHTHTPSTIFQSQTEIKTASCVKKNNKSLVRHCP